MYCHYLILFTYSIDPVTAIRQQYQLLVKMGRSQDIAQLTQEMTRVAQGQVNPFQFTDEGKRQ